MRKTTIIYFMSLIFICCLLLQSGLIFAEVNIQNWQNSNLLFANQDELLQSCREDPPDVEWTYQTGGSEKDRSYSIAQTEDNGYVITGFTESFGAGGRDLWLIRIDQNGSKLWDRTFGGTEYEEGYSVHCTTDGGFLIVGFTDSFGAGARDVWVIKTGRDGTEEWNQTFGGSNFDVGKAGIPTDDGGCVVTGYTSSFGAGSADFWLLKLDASGNLLWDQTIGGRSADYGESVQQTADGGFILAGDTSSFGVGRRDFWLVKTNENGVAEWNQTYGGEQNEFGISLEQTTDGGYIITGHTFSFGAGCTDFWLVKTDAVGNMEWNKTYGGTKYDDCYSIIQTKDNGFILAGYTQSYGAGNVDVWVVRTDSMGNIRWNQTYGGYAWDEGKAIIQTKDRGYIIAGAKECCPGFVWIIKLASDFVNYPPVAPTIEGESEGSIDEEYQYTFTSTDFNEDPLCYYIDWGDETVEEWIGPCNSGIPLIISHIWEEEGEYLIRVKARDIYLEESDWGTLEVSMPHIRVGQNHWTAAIYQFILLFIK